MSKISGNQSKVVVVNTQNDTSSAKHKRATLSQTHLRENYRAGDSCARCDVTSRRVATKTAKSCEKWERNSQKLKHENTSWLHKHGALRKGARIEARNGSHAAGAGLGESSRTEPLAIQFNRTKHESHLSSEQKWIFKIMRLYGIPSLLTAIPHYMYRFCHHTLNKIFFRQ